MPVTGTEPMAQTLNQLLNGELQAAHRYFQAAAWSSQAKLPGCAGFFLGHAAEEMAHMKKILEYMFDIDAPAKLSESPAPEINANNIAGVFKSIFEHEQLVTRNFFDAVKEAERVADLSTREFLWWFVAEQREEEKLFRELLERIDVIGDGPHTLLFIDKEVAEVAARASG